MEEMNRTAEVNREEQDLARKPWQTPAVEDLLVDETATVVSGNGGDLNVYS